MAEIPFGKLSVECRLNLLDRLFVGMRAEKSLIDYLVKNDWVHSVDDMRKLASLNDIHADMAELYSAIGRSVWRPALAENVLPLR